MQLITILLRNKGSQQIRLHAGRITLSQSWINSLAIQSQKVVAIRHHMLRVSSLILRLYWFHLNQNHPNMLNGSLMKALDMQKIYYQSLLSMFVKDENLSAENIVRGPSASGDTFENKSPRSPIYCDAGSKLLPSISSTPAVGILKKYNTRTNDITESAPVMTCKDLEQTMLAHVADTSSPNQQKTVQEHRAEQIAVDQHAAHHLLSLLQKGTNRKGSIFSLWSGCSC